MEIDRDRDPHRNTGLSTQGPIEEGKEGEYEQGSQDPEGLAFPLRQCANGSSPNPAGLGLNEHGNKLAPLNVADKWSE